MELEEILSKHKAHPIIEGNFPDGKSVVFDFSAHNESLSDFDLNNQRDFENYILGAIAKENADFGIGKYAENRILYRRFDLFESGDNRSFHLGIDIWMEAGTRIFSPLQGNIHSFSDNESIGDYGPTIILEHQLENFKFYTLYGHLSKSSLKGKSKGQRIKKGEEIATLGDWEVNVNWPPHLHFQIIKDLKGFEGDFPGVCNFAEKEQWMNNSPNPNLLLKIPGLD